MNIDNQLQILVLEDWEFILDSLGALIQESAPTATIYKATRYEDAIEILSRERIDFALLDFYLDRVRKKTSMDILLYIRENKLCTRTIITSGGEGDGYLTEELVKLCFDNGAMGYIPKAMGGEYTFQDAFESVLKGQIFRPDFIHCNSTQFFSARELEEREAINAILNNDGKLREALFYICKGFSNQDIADCMGVKETTVRRNYLPPLLKAFNVTRRGEIIYEVSQLKIIVPTPNNC
ncbi:MAG: hypothetical protein DM484_17140 [Candidatus Methylumidiphilus alinenensis]|uniref:Response regulatory domain-containing protein n=1 Tax=Candidatus Methylumidiphilus alinenensis TaxID=2202197 RepID=A0A2W4QWF0_9GAMM|nr:MAG: hypothetical protein DM484_17140 [Candidatus Methylumidiphilus alinenensis]